MVSKRFMLGIVFLMISLLSIGACSTASANEVVDITGWIDSVEELHSGIPGRILVSAPDSNTSDKFVITVTDTTIILKGVDGESQEAEFASLSDGQQLEIWFSGAVMESYPAQVSAAKIVILQDSESAYLPLVDDAPSTLNVEISIDELSREKHIARQIEITYPGALVVTLGSNPTTGFSWNEDAITDDVGVLTQIEHKVLTQTGHENVPIEETGIIGASGKEVWIFTAVNSGETTLSFEYRRPWEGGEKAEWTFELAVTVK
jgi:predicted secreted protein